jgi:hypothetical protein
MIQFVRDTRDVLSAPCRDHSVLLSRSLDERLRPGLRFGLWLHLKYCAACRAFRDQITRLRALQAAPLSQAADAGQAMPAEVRERIRSRLHEH